MPAHDPHPEPGRAPHIGVALWTAAQSWRRRLTEEMGARGVPWYGEARANIIPHIGVDGARMAELPARSGLSRQAVHQFVQALAADGIVERTADPDDARGRIVRFTAQGLAVLREADACKRRIERGYAERLGAADFETLLSALEVIAADEWTNDATMRRTRTSKPGTLQRRLTRSRSVTLKGGTEDSL